MVQMVRQLQETGIHAIAEGTFSVFSKRNKVSVYNWCIRDCLVHLLTAKMTLSSAGLLTIADDFVIKDGGTIGVASSTSAIDQLSTGPL